jgi:quercetin dioxygenase-like cupin family protein
MRTQNGATDVCLLRTTTTALIAAGTASGAGLVGFPAGNRFTNGKVIKLPSCSHALCGGGERLGPHRRLTMKIALPSLVAVMAIAAVASTSPADTMAGHTSVSPQDIKWGPAPAMLPSGAEAAVLFGDPSKEGLFVLRLKFPKGYRVPPHIHPVDEVLTVISGTFSMGMGENAHQSKAQPFRAGSFHALPPGTAHYVFIDEETIVQISTVGPWGLTYASPNDDPRQKSQ